MLRIASRLPVLSSISVILNAHAKFFRCGLNFDFRAENPVTAHPYLIFFRSWERMTFSILIVYRPIVDRWHTEPPPVCHYATNYSLPDLRGVTSSSYQSFSRIWFQFVGLSSDNLKQPSSFIDIFFLTNFQILYWFYPGIFPNPNLFFREIQFGKMVIIRFWLHGIF